MKQKVKALLVLLRLPSLQRSLLWIACWLCMQASTASFSQTINSPDFIDDDIGGLIEGLVDPITFDYGRLIFTDRAGDVERLENWIVKMEETVGKPYRENNGTGFDSISAFENCFLMGPSYIVRDGLKFASSADSYEAYMSERETLLGQFRGQMKKIKAVELDAAKKSKTTEPITLMLERMGVTDQAWRKDIMSIYLAEKYSLDARKFLIRIYMQRWCIHDYINSSNLKTLLKLIYWPTLDRYSEKIDEAAWLIVQHAVHDRPFQEEVLSRLKKLYPLGLTAPRNYAFLYDRLHVLAGKPERYGTQGSCRDGEVVKGQLEDTENIDQLRERMEMEPLPACPPR